MVLRHETLANGVGKLSEEARCFELFAPRPREKPYIGRSTSGLVRAEIVPRGCLDWPEGTWRGGRWSHKRSTGRPRLLRKGTQRLGGKRRRQNGVYHESLNGYYPIPLWLEFFFWTDGDGAAGLGIRL